MNFILNVNLFLLVTVFNAKYVLCYNSHGIIHDVGELHWQKRLGATYLQFHPRTLIECAVACLLRSDRCKSINYSRQMLFCELNYNNSLPDNETKSFQYSEIKTWSKNLIGKCQDIKCPENEMCSMETGNCSISDCGPVNFDIPENSALQNHGHHEVGSTVDFICRDDYVMYNKHSGEHQYEGIVKCDASGHWGSLDFVCLACNTYKLYVDTMAELVNKSSSWKDQKYVFRCKTGYNIVKNGTLDFHLQHVEITCNQTSRNWEGTDFFCKKTEALLEDFCQQGYSFNKISNLCYKYHSKNLTHEAAMDVCQQEHAHLLVITNGTVLDTFKSLPEDETVYIDGMSITGSNWTGWTDDILITKNVKTENHQGNVGNKTCLSIKNANIQSTSCDVPAHFICQFELCPQSAGYTYSTENDICYKHFTARQYTNGICADSHASRFLNIYKPIPLSKDKHRAIYKGQGDLKNQTAYYLGNSTSYWTARNQCTRSRSLVKVDTEQIIDTVTAIINNRTNAFRIGALLKADRTYNYQFSDNKSCNFLPNHKLKESDEKHCVRINGETLYSTFNCLKKSRYICQTDDESKNYTLNDESKNYTLSSEEKTLSEAIICCRDTQRSLLRIEKGKDKTSVMNFFRTQNITKNEYFLIDLELKSKNNYHYQWRFDNTYFTDDDSHFKEAYTNDTKDSLRSIIFNISSRAFELIEPWKPMPYLCQTMSGRSWWEGVVKDEWTADAIENKYWTTVQVEKRNLLPYVCEIDTNDTIYRLNLYQRKQFQPGK